MSGVERELRAERLRRVTTMTEQGCPASEIALALGVTKRSVARMRTELGIAQPPTVPLTEDEIRWAEQLLEDGCSIAEVARTLGRSERPLQRRFQGRGWSKGEGARLAALTRRVYPERGAHGRFVTREAMSA